MYTYLTNCCSGGYGAAAPGYGNSTIPDPYSQPQQGYGYGANMGGGAYGGAGYY